MWNCFLFEVNFKKNNGDDLKIEVRNFTLASKTYKDDQLKGFDWNKSAVRLPLIIEKKRQFRFLTANNV